MTRSRRKKSTFGFDLFLSELLPMTVALTWHLWRLVCPEMAFCDLFINPLVKVTIAHRNILSWISFKMIETTELSSNASVVPSCQPKITCSLQVPVALMPSSAVIIYWRGHPPQSIATHISIILFVFFHIPTFISSKDNNLHTAWSSWARQYNFPDWCLSAISTAEILKYCRQILRGNHKSNQAIEAAYGCRQNVRVLIRSRWTLAPTAPVWSGSEFHSGSSCGIEHRVGWWHAWETLSNSIKNHGEFSASWRRTLWSA